MSHPLPLDNRTAADVAAVSSEAVRLSNRSALPLLLGMLLGCLISQGFSMWNRSHTLERIERRLMSLERRPTASPSGMAEPSLTRLVHDFRTERQQLRNAEAGLRTLRSFRREFQTEADRLTRASSALHRMRTLHRRLEAESESLAGMERLLTAHRRLADQMRLTEQARQRRAVAEPVRTPRAMGLASAASVPVTLKRSDVGRQLASVSQGSAQPLEAMRPHIPQPAPIFVTDAFAEHLHFTRQLWQTTSEHFRNRLPEIQHPYLPSTLGRRSETVIEPLRQAMQTELLNRIQ